MREKLHYKKKLGQHFLHDPRVIEQIVSFIAPLFSDHIIEIGPGAGALTAHLVRLVQSLDAIEFDRDVIPVLQKNCKNAANLHIFVEDVLRVDFFKFQPPLRVVGNLPYNISTPLLFHLIKNIAAIKDMHFMLQKEVAERITAKPGSRIYGRLSVMVQYYCETKLLMHVGSGAFFPPPKVDSAFIRLIPRTQREMVAKNEEKFGEIVRTAFCKRRKTILNSLKQYITSDALARLAIDPKMRPEQLTVKDFVSISNLCS